MIKLLSNHLFIEPIEEEKKTESGIILPETIEKEKLESRVKFLENR